MAEKGKAETAIEVILRPTDRGSPAANGNLVEAPIWRLDKSAARPRNKDGSIDLKQYVLSREYQRNGPKGEVIRHKVTIKANPHFGYPTMFGNRIMHGLLREAARREYDSPRIPASLADICRWLDVQPGKQWYRLIVQQLEAMMGTTFLFHDSWYVIENGQRVGSIQPGIHPIKLIEKFQFRPLVRKGLQQRQADLGLDCEDWVLISDEVFKSARTYKVPLDLPYMNRLSGGLAQRLYEYLEKRNYGKPMYRERLSKLAARLPLAKRAPSAIRAELTPALEQLKVARSDGKRLIADYRFVLPDGRNKVLNPEGKAVSEPQLYVWFARAVGVGIAARMKAKHSGQPEPQLAFDEDFFYPDDEEADDE